MEAAAGGAGRGSSVAADLTAVAATCWFCPWIARSSRDRRSGRFCMTERNSAGNRGPKSVSFFSATLWRRRSSDDTFVDSGSLRNATSSGTKNVTRWIPVNSPTSVPGVHKSVLHRDIVVLVKRDGVSSRLGPVFLWRDQDNVAHCRLMPFDEAGWQFVQTSLCRWWCGPVAGKLLKVNPHTKEENVDSFDTGYTIYTYVGLKCFPGPIIMCTIGRLGVCIISLTRAL